ncbi:hypothetical protein AA0311_0529 [Asaia bogorensis NBRC 16594]|nr:hypothetical protein AA0311_0529 [Asaia bogorensis NBRC 16594]
MQMRDIPEIEQIDRKDGHQSDSPCARHHDDMAHDAAMNETRGSGGLQINRRFRILNR